MLISLFFIVFAFVCFRGLVSDKHVAGLMLLIGFTQDPVRKLIAGEPVFMTIMVGLVVACIAARCALDARRPVLEPFVGWSQDIALPLSFYLLIVALQAVQSIVLYKSPILTGLGAIFYIAPLVAIVVGYFLFRRFENIRQFMEVFCVMAIIIALSVFVSFLGIDSELLGEVGSGLVIYDQGTVLKAYSGLMRSSEIASWHMGACVCFLIILVFDRSSLTSSVVVSTSIALLLAAIILTGRRKMLVQIAIFGFLYFPILRYYQGRLSTRFLFIALIGAGLLSSIYLFMPSLEGTEYDLYLARGATVFGDAGERFSTLGLGSIEWAYHRYGWFGGGLGVATQGAQHFGSVSAGGAGEGGLGKLVSELGVFALFFIAWLGWAFARHLHRCISLVAAAAVTKLPLVIGCLVFLIANIPTFVIASQVFGDVFVLIILGSLTGALFALPTQVISGLKTTRQDRVQLA